ncbi:MAG TPA: hypothetical protein DDX05_06070 [Deltaproteobacteria bacterium]|nr:MAG: hypothetical protein A2X91_03945 [Deltaproteobacteria bacterium GWB2_65_81]OGP36851.1 MAG: hypothetical protein A2X98_04370 [Deltaproteobacteria bacterium GWC2_66_88]HAM33425.1 hypothetical protein [Deltaproteobacteria bacterium]HBG73174.1 hypothetical protein [Deltaproteobacteria bacterium]
MNAKRFRSAMKSVVAVLCAACFLTMTFGAASRAIAADEWPVWPKKGAEPGVEATPTPPPPQVQPGAAKEGSEAGQAVKKGTSTGTIGWIALGIAGAIGIGVAASGGSSGGTTSGH